MPGGALTWSSWLSRSLGAALYGLSSGERQIVAATQDSRAFGASLTSTSIFQGFKGFKDFKDLKHLQFQLKWPCLRLYSLQRPGHRRICLALGRRRELIGGDGCSCRPESFVTLLHTGTWHKELTKD